jgi:hypothetical protein
MQLSPSLLKKKDPELAALCSTKDGLSISDRDPIINNNVGPLTIFANVNSINTEFVWPAMRILEKFLHSVRILC